jgi:hypothetical protein
MTDGVDDAGEIGGPGHGILKAGGVDDTLELGGARGEASMNRSSIRIRELISIGGAVNGELVAVPAELFVIAMKRSSAIGGALTLQTGMNFTAPKIYENSLHKWEECKRLWSHCISFAKFQI